MRPTAAVPCEVECYGCGAPLDGYRCDYCGRRAAGVGAAPRRPQPIVYDDRGRLPMRPTPQGDWECEPGFAERFLERISRGKAKAINLSGRARGPLPPAGNDVQWK